jgi:tetratricopeptide (TPR) repeat protein
MDEAVDTADLKQQLMADGHEAFDAADYTRALEFYHRAALLDSSDGGVWTSIGLTFNNLEFPRETWRSYLLALQMDPRNADALWYAAEFLFEIEDLPLADLFLGHYLNVEADSEKQNEARQLRREIHAEAQARGVVLEQDRAQAAEEVLEGTPNAELLQEGDEGSSPEVEQEEQEVQLSEEELEEIAMADGRFVAPLMLRLSGFEGRCDHCKLQIPFDAPYCWSCKMIHFYE